MKSRWTSKIRSGFAKLRSALLILAVCACLSAATLTQVRDTLVRADGGLFTGAIEVSWPTFQTAAGESVPSGVKRVEVRNGVLSVDLIPYNGYNISYSVGGRVVAREIWGVLESPTPLKVSSIRTVLSDSTVITFSSLSGQPTDNPNLASALNAKISRPSTASASGKCLARTVDNLGEEYRACGEVVSVAGRQGAVVLNSADVGLGNVDNTSDVNKPVSTATQSALNLKADQASLNTHISDNTTALAGKADLAHAARHKNGGADEVGTATPAANVIPKAKSDGTLDAGFLPPPTELALGGVKRNTGTGCVSGIDVDGSLLYTACSGGTPAEPAEPWSASIDFTEIEVGRHVCASFTATGLLSGTPIVEGWPSLPSGLVGSNMRASADNTVEVCVWNDGADAVDPTALTFKASLGGGGVTSGGGVNDPGANGIMVRTSLNTTVARTVIGTDGEVTVNNGSGTGGNPQISLPSAIDLSGKQLRLPNGASLPVPACLDGSVYINNSATTGRRVYVCENGSYVAQGGGSNTLPDATGNEGKFLSIQDGEPVYETQDNGFGLEILQVTGKKIWSVDCGQVPCLAKDNAFTGNNQFVGTLGMFPSTTQTLIMSSTITVLTTALKQVSSDSAIVMTTAPTIPDATFDGQSIFLLNVGTYNITLQDEDNLAGSNLCMPGNVNKVIEPKAVSHFIFSTAAGCWAQVN